jgi:hypothetical protein
VSFTTTTRTTRRWLLRAGLAVVMVAVLAGAYLLGAHRAEPTPAPPPPEVGMPPVPPGGVAASADPALSAVAWLRGYRTLSWTDASPSAWSDRVLPVVTPQLGAQYHADRGGGGGAEWTDFVAQRCTTTVSGADAVIPDEAPRSDGEVYVQVTGDAVTTCMTGAPPGGGTEHVAATLQLVRGTDQLWRVARRVF